MTASARLATKNAARDDPCGMAVSTRTPQLRTIENTVCLDSGTDGCATRGALAESSAGFPVDSNTHDDESHPEQLDDRRHLPQHEHSDERGRCGQQRQQQCEGCT